jgi:organic hydroperoxide reductase OsmC/OhrA
MATYIADIDWKLAEGDDFPKGRYSRGHTLTFDGGTVVPASASPHVVGKWSVKEAVDPEEMLVAALSNCHMLSFLQVARLAGFTVAAYHHHAGGVMEENCAGQARRDEGCPASQDRMGRGRARTGEAGPSAS